MRETGLRALAVGLVAVAMAATSCADYNGDGVWQADICGTVLASSVAGGFVYHVGTPAPTVSAMSPGAVIVQVSDDCAHGATVSLSPPGAFRVAHVAPAKDGLPAGVQLTPVIPTAPALLTASRGGRRLGGVLIWLAATFPLPSAAPTLGDLGPVPADAGLARTQIRAAFDRALTGAAPGVAGATTTGKDRDAWVLGAVEDGPALRATLDRVSRGWPAQVASAQVTVDAVVFMDTNHAAVEFTLSYRQPNALAASTMAGQAVRVGTGTDADPAWKLSRATYCTVLGLTGTACPGQS
jgi:hypothetical protein